MNGDDIVNEFKDKIDAEKAILAQKKELDLKRMEIDKRRVERELNRIHKAEDDAKKAETVNYGVMSEEYIASLQTTNREYMEAATHSMKFICPTFDGVVPFFRKNLICIGGKTGEGKSTAVANIIFQSITQVNKRTGKTARVLVLTNEEQSADVYNRVTCLIKGWAYTNHDKFTKEQKEEMDRMIPILARDSRLVVIDDSYGGVSGNTTSVEGIKTIFDNLIRNKEFFDVVVLDYYQNVNHSREDPKLADWKCQEMLSSMLDQYKNIYPAPIVVMAQVKPPDAAETPFELRMKGSKSISVRATMTMEMVAEREFRRTNWIPHKSRFTEALGKTFHTGFKYGKFVEYTDEFKKEALAAKEQAQWAATVGKNVFKDKEPPKNESQKLEEAGIKGEEVKKD